MTFNNKKKILYRPDNFLKIFPSHDTTPIINIGTP